MTKLTKWIIPTMPVFLVASLVSGCATKAESTPPVTISNPSVYAGLECVYWDKHFSEQTRLCQVWDAYGLPIQRCLVASWNYSMRTRASSISDPCYARNLVCI